jgi:hypothetical protein
MSFNVIPANLHDGGGTTKHESHPGYPHVIPAQAGIQRNRLDNGFRRYDATDFHRNCHSRVLVGQIEWR